MLVGTIRSFFAKQALAPGRLLVAVSGGGDSMALLVALHELAEHELVAVHVNHHLRGEASDADEAFVRALCETRGIALVVADGTLDPAALKDRGIEAAARERRRAAFTRIREERQASWIVTAHHRDDQAETVLMRLLRGAEGRGMQPVTDDGYLRPLLRIGRSAIEAFLAQRHLRPRHDASNDDVRFVRNRVRHQLLPALRTLDPDVDETLATQSTRSADSNALFAKRLAESEQRCLVQTPTTSRFRIAEIPAPPMERIALFRRQLARLDPNAREVSAEDLSRIVGQLHTLKRLSVTRLLELARVGDELHLRPRLQETAPYDYPLLPDHSVDTPAGRLHLRRLAAPPDFAGAPARQLFQLPPGADAPFLIRNRRPGERFRPLGLPQEKKLNAFLIDRKIERFLRDRLPLLIWNGTVVAVAGVAVSDAFRIAAEPGQRFELILEGRT